MVLRLLAASAEHRLGNQLNDYLRDPDEYRAITRHLLHLGGTITCTPRVITVPLDPPVAPRVARALGLLLDEINNNPSRMQAIPGPSPTSSPRRPSLGFNNDQGPTAGGLRLRT